MITSEIKQVYKELDTQVNRVKPEDTKTSF